VCALIACSVAPAVAAEWTEFVDKAERFGVNLPGKPDVRDIMFTSWRGAVVPAKVYTVKDGPRSYSVTVVNYQTVAEAGVAGVTDVLGSIAWAAWNVRKRPGIEITYDAYTEADHIEGHEIYLVNPDKSRTNPEMVPLPVWAMAAPGRSVTASAAMRGSAQAAKSAAAVRFMRPLPGGCGSGARRGGSRDRPSRRSRRGTRRTSAAAGAGP